MRHACVRYTSARASLLSDLETRVLDATDKTRIDAGYGADQVGTNARLRIESEPRSKPSTGKRSVSWSVVVAYA